MTSANQSEILVAPSESIMIPPQSILVDVDKASHDGADSGIDMKIQQKAGQIQAAGKTAVVDEEPTLSTMQHNTSTRGSWYDIPSERLVTSPVIGRYSTDLMQQRLLRLSTVSARNSSRHQRTFHHPIGESPDLPKVISWYEATESRPPLRIDMSGPSPTTYSPNNKPLYETNAPAYSFGRKETEKTGSGQKAWGKLWFRSGSPFTYKTNYEMQWPSPFHYQQKSTLGPKQVNKTTFPSHSIGPVQTVSTKKPRLKIEPVPTLYYPEVVSLSRMRRAPAHSMGRKLSERNWTPSMNVPAPNVYDPLTSVLRVKPSPPSYTVRGMRRHKRHDLGPFFTL